ncbi:hypothetical protein EV700_2674 [Fluviicoccus keumensis]|uniref:Uncharacterized protein n=1 Tax=Fluviicoccus keumensis TaxID=1435465 RepID=A0A4Q7YKP3_9GAMM|nr:hypothetical protein [Fluviicoccus keumensis]RZU38097.1 hypothetical protein EV700_2674 [Fluviicoccus keumensis]
MRVSVVAGWPGLCRWLALCGWLSAGLAQAEEVAPEPLVAAPSESAIAPASAAESATGAAGMDPSAAPVPDQGINAISIPVRDCLQRDAEGRFLGWLDEQHCRISTGTATTAQWLDGLFGTWYGPEDAKVRLRIIVSERWEEGGGLDAGNSIRASAILPNAKRRLKLVVGDDEDVLHRGQDINTVPPVPASTSAAIRWFPEYFGQVKYTFDVGLRSTPDIFTRVRAQRLWHLGEDSVLHFTETLKYGVKDRGRSITQLDAERALDSKTAFLLSNSLYYWELEPDPVGLRWGQDWVILHNLGHQRSVSYGVMFEGAQQPEWHLLGKSIFFLYRESIWRPWLFVELEPHLTRREETHWETTPSVILRFEAQFGL